jgi:DNA-binding Lrp family transcriptional regulator
MLKIDKKDRKIIYHLLHNSRQPLNTIGKEVGLSRKVVGYRINRLEKEGIITGYPTFIQSTVLGWGTVRYYLTFQFISPEKKQEIIDYFINSDIVVLVSDLEGSYDLQINVYISSLRTFEHPKKYQNLFLKFTSFYDQLQKKYRKYFDEQIMTVFQKSTFFDPIFLLRDKNLTPSALPIFSSSFKGVQIDKLDFEILKKLAVNARIPTVKLAHDLNVTTTTIKNRIKSLINEKVIGKFGLSIDLSKIGYRLYNVEINLKDYDKKYEIIEYIHNNQNITEIDESFGRGVDLDFEFVLEDRTQLQDIINDLSSKFPDAIKNFRYYSHVKIHKHNYIPFK